MAIVYCDSNAAGANDGTSWTDAYTTLSAAGSGATSGTDVIHLASDHSEVVSAAVSSSVSAIYRIPVYSVNSSTDVYEPATAAQFTSTLTTAQFTGVFDFYGVYIEADNNLEFAPTYNGRMRFYDCILHANAAASSIYGLKLTGKSTEFSTRFEFYNCEFKWEDDTYWQPQYGHTYCENCVFTVASTATVYSFGWIYHGAAMGPLGCQFVGCDLSAIDFSTGEVVQNANQEGWNAFQFVNCKLPSNFGSGGYFNSGRNEAQYIELIGCQPSNSGNDNYFKVDAFGNEISTTTTIYCDTGYLSADGSTRVSHKFAPSADMDYVRPMYSPDIIGYVSTTGSKTFTVELASDFGTALTDQDVMLEVVFQDTAGYGLMDHASSGPNDGAGSLVDPLDTGSTLTTSSQTWTGAGSLTNKQKVSVTAAVNSVGWFKARLVLTGYESGKVIHYNPYVTIS